MDEVAPELEPRELSEEMRQAVERGDVGEIHRRLDAGEDVDAATSTGATAMHVAAWKDQADAMAELIKRGADINRQKNEQGYTPLMHAAFFNSTKCAKLLMDNGADVSLCTRSKSAGQFLPSGTTETALEIAERRHGIRKPENVAMLINEAETKRWLDKAREYGELSEEMATAAQEGDVQTIERLIDAGAHVHAIDEGGRTALHLAAENNQAVAVRLLWSERGANIEARTKNGWTPLINARTSIDTTKELLHAGADTIPRVTSLDFLASGRNAYARTETASDMARRRGSTDIVDVLAAYKAYRKWDPDLLAQAQKAAEEDIELPAATPIMIDGRRGRCGLSRAPGTAFLICCSDLVASSAAELTPGLYFLHRYGGLVEYHTGGSTHRVLYDGETKAEDFKLTTTKWELVDVLDLAPEMQTAAEAGDLATIESLAAAGERASPREREAASEHLKATDGKYGMTALHWAAFKNQADAVEKMLSLNANINARDKWEQTPLMLAARYTNAVDAAKKLCDAGADRTGALEIAEQVMNTQVRLFPPFPTAFSLCTIFLQMGEETTLAGY
eukprot:COSAG02_NODE_1613_length_11675_cov_8.562716_3_plen_563_part_00